MAYLKKISMALIVISDRVSRGERSDGVEKAVRLFLGSKGYEIAQVDIIPDEADIIQAKIVELADSGKFHLVLTSGGTGLAPRDVTPEATRPILEKEIPGIPEAMRAESLKITDRAPLSRGLAGLRGGVMIINLPGSPKAAVENIGSVFNAIIHGIEKAQGDPSDCDTVGSPNG